MGASNKACPNCGRKMKQQFPGLQHCRCGMSWKKDIGYFERTPDMVLRWSAESSAKSQAVSRHSHRLCSEVTE